MLLRTRVPELMDDPALDDALHFDALQGLEKINTISNGASFVWKALHSYSDLKKGLPLKVLDLATGGGDTPIALGLIAEKSGISMQIDGCDFSIRAVEYAKMQAAKVGAKNQFFHLDALKDELPQDYDVIMCSLFMHHLDPEDVTLLLKKMATATKLSVLVNDLLRSSINMLLVKLATRMLSSSAVVHYDGPVSVKAAYTIEEMKAMALSAGLSDADVTERFPCRYLLQWNKRAGSK